MRKAFLIVSVMLSLVGQKALCDQVNIGFGPSLDSSSFQPHVADVEFEKNLGQLALEFHAAAIFSQPIVGAFSVVPCAKVVTPDGMFLRVGVGIGLITATTDRMSSIGEFNIEAAGGLNVGRVEIGPRFNHWSNGSIIGKGPNLGQDALLLGLGVAL